MQHMHRYLLHTHVALGVHQAGLQLQHLRLFQLKAAVAFARRPCAELTGQCGVLWCRPAGPTSANPLTDVAFLWLLSLTALLLLLCCPGLNMQVHPGQMGSTVAWLPQQPLCVSSISKQGQLVLQDVRLLGRPLLQQQLQGPVYDAVWMAAGPSSSSGSSAWGAAGPAAGVQELQLVVAGRDSCLRLYCLDTPALQQGGLGVLRVRQGLLLGFGVCRAAGVCLGALHLPSLLFDVKVCRAGSTCGWAT